eukprot:1161606-Pelagomonas_calceolata.AAC.1
MEEDMFPPPHSRIPLDNSKWKSKNWRPLSIHWRPDISPRSPIPPGKAPCCFNCLCYLARSSLAVSWSTLAACPFITAPLVFCPGTAAPAAAPAAGGGWCWCLNVRRLRPGVGIAGAAVVKRKEKLRRPCKHPPHQLRKRGYLGPRHRVSPSPRETKERSQWGSGVLLAVALTSCVAGTATAFGGVGVCAAGTVAAVCVGGRAGNAAAAADGGGNDGAGLAAAAAAGRGGHICSIQSKEAHLS